MIIEDEELRNLYKTSGEEHLQKLEAGLLHLQKYPDDEATLEQLQREVHSLKGDSRSVGIENVETLAHTVEEIILSLKRQQTALTPQVSESLYQGLNAIALLVEEAVTDQPSGVDISQILDHLTESVSDSNELQQEAAHENAKAPQAAPIAIPDKELRNLYQTSCKERLQKLKAGLLHLQKHPGDEAMLERLRREAHSIKGDSRIVGIENVETLATRVKEILSSIKRQQTTLTPQLSESLDRGLEAMGLLVEEAVTGQPSGVDTDEMLNYLMKVVLEPPHTKLGSNGLPTGRGAERAGEAGGAGEAGEVISLSATWDELQLEASLEQGDVPVAALSLIEDEELREIFKIASEERLQKLQAGLLHLQNYPNDEATLEQLRREAHSLKGDSRSVGVDTVGTFAQTIEEILSRIKHQQAVLTPQVSERLDQGLMAIALLVEEAVTGQPSGVDTAEILNLLLEVVWEPPEPQLEASLEQGDVPVAASSLLEDEELREIFKIASEERLQKLQAGLLHLQNYPNDEATLEELLREAHSLKGDSRSVGVETVETIAHTIEEILGSLQRQQAVLTPQVSESLDRGLEAIGLLVEEAVTGQPSGVDTAEILNLLLEVVLETPESQLEVTLEHSNVPVVAPTAIEDEELREIFKIASEERLQKLQDGLLHLEKHPNDEATLEELLREAHSLKGDSRSVGIETVETLVHTVEEIFLSIQSQQTVLTPQVSDRLYEGLDAIGLLVREAVTGQPSRLNTAEILNHLMEVVSAPTTQESLPVPPIASSLPVKAATQDLPSPSLDVGEPYRIDTVRVHTRELDAIMTQAEELTVTKIAIARAAAEIDEMASLWEDWKAFNNQRQYRNSSSSLTNPYQERLEKIINSLRTSTQEHSNKLDFIAGDLREKIRDLRLLPLSTLFQVFPRMVRDLARQQSKEVELIIEGGETTADKRILEEIKDSLMHMVRNAIDHGIETAAEREKLGKPPVATIWLRGYQTTNNIVIEVADDGRGLDIEKIKQTALKRGLYQKEELEVMTPSQIYALIFAPGFSTRTFITEISGRGIGLDVVRTNVERLKGNIQIKSTLGQGCTFGIQLSTTLTTVNAMLLDIQGIVHAIPVEFVQTTLLVSQEQISTTESQETIVWDGQDVSVANLTDLLELSNSPAYALTAKVEQQKSALQTCILLKVGEEQFGVFVDRLLDTQEVLLKPQSQLLKRVRNVTGATILPTGEVCMILNPPDLLKSLQKQTTPVASIQLREKVQRKPVILLVEDSIPVRTQEKRLLEGAGYEVVIAVDGLDGYNTLQTRDFDGVLSDVEMPNLDGLSLTAKIRQHPEYQELPIILVTTLDSDEDKRRGAQAGANAYVIKGKFNQDVLLEILGRIV